MSEFVSERLKIMLGKEENTGYPYFLLKQNVLRRFLCLGC